MAEKEVVDSLKQISKNLENINDTLKENKTNAPNTETTDEWNKRIELIIREVESKCRRKYVTPRRVGIIALVVVFAVILAIGLLWLYSIALNASVTAMNEYLQTTNQTLTPEQMKTISEQVPSLANLAVGVIATIVALWTVMLSFLFTTSTQTEIADSYYSKLRKDFEVQDRPYLKALINMKCKEFDVSLIDSYRRSLELHSGLFSEKHLLESLY